jgi:hypothetical protein
MAGAPLSKHRPASVFDESGALAIGDDGRAGPPFSALPAVP